MKHSSIFFCLVGPAGGGKTTFCERLSEIFKESMKLSISATSRSPRSNEKPGESYIFLSRQEFETRKDKGEFFEWEEVHGNLYGTLKSTIDEAIKEKTDLLFDIDIKGALNTKKHFPERTVIIFILPPSFKILCERLESRGLISEKEKKTRYETAKWEYKMLLECVKDREGVDYLLVNDLFDSSLSQLQSIVYAERSHLLRYDVNDIRMLCTLE